MSRTTSDVLVERLIDWGVGVVFGLPGDGINGIMEALRTRQDRISFLQVLPRSWLADTRSIRDGSACASPHRGRGRFTC